MKPAGDVMQRAWCGKITKHDSHFYPGDEPGETIECPGYEPLPDPPSSPPQPSKLP